MRLSWSLTWLGAATTTSSDRVRVWIRTSSSASTLVGSVAATRSPDLVRPRISRPKRSARARGIRPGSGGVDRGDRQVDHHQVEDLRKCGATSSSEARPSATTIWPRRRRAGSVGVLAACSANSSSSVTSSRTCRATSASPSRRRRAPSPCFGAPVRDGRPGTAGWSPDASPGSDRPAGTDSGVPVRLSRRTVATPQCDGHRGDDPGDHEPAGCRGGVGTARLARPGGCGVGPVEPRASSATASRVARRIVVTSRPSTRRPMSRRRATGPRGVTPGARAARAWWRESWVSSG